MNDADSIIMSTINEVVSTISNEELNFWVNHSELLKGRIEKCFVRFNRSAVKYLGTIQVQSNLLSHYIKLMRNGFFVGPVTEDLILNEDLKIKPTPCFSRYDIFMASSYDITGKQCSNIPEIYKAIQTNGYELCPVSAALEFRLAYKDQPHNQFVRVAMKPITDVVHNCQYILVLGCDQTGLWTEFDTYCEEYIWSNSYNWLFVKKK